MNVKTRLFSVILLGILVLPVFFNPPQSGNVLGVNETKSSDNLSDVDNGEGFSIGSVFNSNNTQTNQEIQKNSGAQTNTQSPEYKLKDISSGIRDIKKKNSNEPKTLTGRVVWDTNNKSSVTSDKFPLGSGVKVKYGDKESDAVIGDTRILAPDVLLSVDQKTFTLIGGDLEKQTSIDVTITIE